MLGFVLRSLTRQQKHSLLAYLCGRVHVPSSHVNLPFRKVLIELHLSHSPRSYLSFHFYLYADYYHFLRLLYASHPRLYSQLGRAQITHVHAAHCIISRGWLRSLERRQLSELSARVAVFGRHGRSDRAIAGQL